MSESLHQSLTEIRQHTPELNKLTDEAAQVVVMVEKFLSDTGVGMFTEVEAGKFGYNDLKLSYQRSGGRFRITVAAWGELYDERDGDVDYGKAWEKPWTDCPRAEKLCSFKALPKLLLEIAEEEKRAVREMGGTAETIKAVMSAIKN